MKHEIHKINWSCHGSPQVKFAGESPECGDYQWKIGSKIWRYVTCKKCLAIKFKEKYLAKLMKKQGKLFK